MGTIRENGTIKSTRLGVERGVFMGFCIDLVFDGTGQALVGYVYDEWNADKKDRVLTDGKFGESVRGILKAVGVESWEQLPGKNVRIIRDSGSWNAKIVAIGHIVKDQWFYLGEVFDG